MPFVTVKVGDPQPAPRGKRLRYLQLFDLYGPVLTDTQREICNLYFMCDLSLSEIAEQKGISKQAVSDALKTSRELLDFYEGKLRFNEQTQSYSLAVSYRMTDVSRALEAFAERHPEFSEEILSIADMVSVGELIDLKKEE